MKKILALTILFTMIVSGLCFGEIKYKKDDFNGDKYMVSTFKNYLASPFTFISCYSTDNHDNEIYFVRIEKHKWYFFSKEPVQMKLNNNTDSNSEDYCTTTLCITIPQELIDKVENSNAITFRVCYNNHPYTIYEVPKAMLDEWKKVLDKNHSLQEKQYNFSNTLE